MDTERGNRNEIVHTFFFQIIANTKLINLKNYPTCFLRISNLFLSFSSTLQLVVLDGRIAANYTPKNYITSDSKFFTIVNLIIDIANSFYVI